MVLGAPQLRYGDRVMKRSWVLSLALVAAGCGFEGDGAAPAEDDGSAAQPGSGNGNGSGSDTPKPVVCGGYTKVGASYYLLATDRTRTHAEAGAYCASRPVPGHLATFDTLAKIDAVHAAFPGRTASAWTGVVQLTDRRSGVSQDWHNLVANRSIPQNFPWLSGEPNDGNGYYYEDGDEDFADLRADGKFDDAGASRGNHVLCECDPPAAP